ncbi:zinc-binding alcohol dehydrogenase family protein [Massilia sp. P8910]|uniref:zinc-binding alcohol dehydrogenase family protein n=1 Tax=Massilia antarctica TaxID=2765360 RepID=UPI001E43A51E|nr:zinc-binding alcohol dehydrogenase family protein [Massilia antarctica]MCE3603490.1 zinc-binding alcohol dehydrogenase family protein [Massilia antarctica]
MKAIAVINGTLHDVELPVPQPQGRDLVVKVEAISVNPVDFKQRKAAAHDGEPSLVGWDVAGTVSAVGPQATLFKVGDAVYYAGSVVRPGANSEFHAVDERIVGRKPASLSMEQAAALPLTSITAWEALFERLGVSRSGADEGKSVLIIGGAGGVGSIAIQLAKKLAKLNVIATASRRASEQWCRALGADHVIDHLGDMPAQLAALGLAEVDFILCLNDIDAHFAAMAAAIAPQGKICAIVRNERPLPMDLVFGKSVTVVFEMMFTRSMFGTADMIEQHKLLNEVAALVDAGVLTTTVGESGGRIDAANLTRAHAALEAGRTIGKIVLSGF